MKIQWRRWWPVAKAVLAVVIVVGVGAQFARILQKPELWQQPLRPRPEWLTTSALLYVLAFAFPALYWHRLLWGLGEQPTTTTTVRAYYVAHLGKYVPGKAWALILRTTLARERGVRTSIAALTATYETLTTMASGALVAIVLLSLHALDVGHRWQAAVLLAVAGIPILPPVFNRVVARVSALAARAARQRQPETENTPLPRLRNRTLVAGLALTACGWGVMGLSLGAMLQAILPEPPTWSPEAWGRHTAFIALAYVAGFLTLPAPGGLGVRELILQQSLTPELALQMPSKEAAAYAAVIALALRLLWTVAEVIMAASVYWLPATGIKKDASPTSRDQTAPADSCSP